MGRTVRPSVPEPSSLIPLRVLVLEDSPADAELSIHHLRRGGFEPEWRRVDTRADFLNNLDPAPDLILADYSMPGFSALTALDLLQQRGDDVPLIVVSGSIGDALAIETLKRGAADYVLKDRMQRLGDSVSRVLDDRRVRRENQRLAAVVRSSRDAIISTDVRSVIESWNAGAERLFGYSAHEVIGRPVQNLLSTNADELDRMFLTAWQGERVESVDTVCVQKNGSVVDVSLTISPILTPAQDVIGFALIGRDMSARKYAETMLQESETRYRSMFEDTRFALHAGGIGIWESDQGEVKWSNALEAMHGLAPGAFAGTLTGFLDLVHPEDRDSVRESVESSTANNTDSAIEYRTTWPDGSVHWIVRKGRKVSNEAGEVVRVIGIGIDVTERRQLEAQFLQAQKMEGIGQLAGGVAHDFNNLLTAILGYAEILKDELGTRDHHRRDIDEIRKAAERAAGLTRQLLAFSRKQILKPAVLDLNLVVENLSTMMRRLIGEHINLTLRLDPNLGRVKADAGQLEQVIVNLAVNARDAMPQGGALTIQTSNVELDGTYMKEHHIALTESRQFVMVAVSDTGTGMTKETQKRIFEPFFTTKARGEGTGLGLATVYGIVKQSEGYIWVYSELGQGTAFKVYLPRVDAPATEKSDARDVRSTASGGSETVLVVEDEESVRVLSRLLLERSGYRVLDASNPQEAKQIVAGEADRIDLLLTDVVMPDGSGPELFDHLTVLRPDMKVCYMSGYIDHSVVPRGTLPPEAPFLQKPFTAASIVRKVREVLDQNGH